MTAESGLNLPIMGATEAPQRKNGGGRMAIQRSEKRDVATTLHAFCTSSQTKP
jgi:hypothetical protein